MLKTMQYVDEMMKKENDIVELEIVLKEYRRLIMKLNKIGCRGCGRFLLSIRILKLNETEKLANCI